jgi:hypothetical protein
LSSTEQKERRKGGRREEGRKLKKYLPVLTSQFSD